MITGIILVFLLNVLASAMSVTNTLLISKGIMKPVYIIMFIDAIVFTTGLKMVANQKGYLIVVAYGIGKVTGAFLAKQIERKLAIGVLEVIIFAKPKRAITIADALREMGYGVTTMKGYGLNGNPRFSVNITIQRKELKLLKEILKKYDYNDSTMIIQEISGVEGKIKTTHNKEIDLNL